MGDIEQGQTTPLVSVVIPILNEVRTIDDTLASVLGQTYRHIEVLAVDGMSDDGTILKLQAWSERDDRVRILPQSSQSDSGGTQHCSEGCRRALYGSGRCAFNHS